MLVSSEDLLYPSQTVFVGGWGQGGGRGQGKSGGGRCILFSHCVSICYILCLSGVSNVNYLLKFLVKVIIWGYF